METIVEWFSKRGISFGQIDLSLSRELLGLDHYRKMCCSIDGKRLIVRSDRHLLSVLSTKTWECLSKFDLLEYSSYSALTALPDGRIACGSDDGSVSILLFGGDVLSLQMTLFDGDDGSYNHMSYRRGATAICLNLGGFLITVDFDNILRMFSIAAPTAAESEPDSYRHSIASFGHRNEFGELTKSLILLKSGLVASSDSDTICIWKKTSTGMMVSEIEQEIDYAVVDYVSEVSGICLWLNTRCCLQNL